MYSEELERCPTCYMEYEPELVLIEPITAIHLGRIVEFGGQSFISKRVLDIFEDYSFSEIGDIIRVHGHGGHDIFFELAGIVEGWGEEPEPSYLLIRVDPDDAWPKDWPVLDVNPEDAVKLDGKKEA